MSDFAAESLLALAKARYGEGVLQNRMTGAAGDPTKADIELLEIARSVVERVHAAAQESVGWPLTGKDPDTDTPYREAWPKNVLQKALQLFNWRTQAGFEGVSIDQRKVGEAAEAFFLGLAGGDEPWGTAVSTDVGSPLPVTARSRDGSSNTGTARNRRNLLDEFSGAGFDWAR